MREEARVGKEVTELKGVRQECDSETESVIYIVHVQLTYGCCRRDVATGW